MADSQSSRKPQTSAGDYSASEVTNDSGVAGTTVKNALDTLNAGANPTLSQYSWQIINNTGGIPGNQKEAVSDIPWTCPFGAQFMFEHYIPAVDTAQN